MKKILKWKIDLDTFNELIGPDRDKFQTEQNVATYSKAGEEYIEDERTYVKDNRKYLLKYTVVKSAGIVVDCSVDAYQYL